MNVAKRIPVTVLTGFLGSGKTTLLNRIISGQHGRRIAIIENEFGEVGVDSELVIGAEEEIFEANNGCLCCTVRGDLIRILGQLVKRCDRFDFVLIETTGLADPGPVIQTFFVDEDLKAHFELDAIVTLVDAKHIAGQLEETDKAGEQIAFADLLLLNKTDLVSEAQLQAVERRLRTINTQAAIVRTRAAEVPLERVLGIKAFDLSRVLDDDAAFLERDAGQEHGHDHDHHHDDDHQGDGSRVTQTHDADISSVGLTGAESLEAARVNDWLSQLLQEHGRDIFRMKGVLNLRGEDRRYVFHGVHMTFDGRLERNWEAGPRVNRLVFIGRNLNRGMLEAGFRSCLA